MGIASRDLKKTTEYAKKYNIPIIFNSYEDLIKSPKIDIIYNPLPVIISLIN